MKKITLTFISFFIISGFIANANELLSVSEIKEKATSLEIPSVSVIDKFIGDATKDPYNNEIRGLTAKEYVQLYKDSKNEVRSTEELSNYCIIANVNDQSINVSECMKGELYPNIVEIHDFLESVKIRGLEVAECVDSYALKASEITRVNQTIFNRGASGPSYDAKCAQYGNGYSGKKLAIDIPMQVTKEGSSSGYTTKTLHSDNVSSLSHLRNIITNDCLAILRTKGPGSTAYQKYCSSYLNNDVHYRTFSPPYLGKDKNSHVNAMRNYFGGGAVYWDCYTRIWGKCTNGRYKYKSGNHYYRQGNTYLRQNIYIAGSNSRGTTSRFIVAEENVRKIKTSGRPTLVDVKPYWTPNTNGIDILNIYNTIYGDKQLSCSTIGVKHIIPNKVEKMNGNSSNDFFEKPYDGVLYSSTSNFDIDPWGRYKLRAVIKLEGAYTTTNYSKACYINITSGEAMALSYLKNRYQ
jgi:hypothetical protein